MTLRQVVFERCTTHPGLSALIGLRCWTERLEDDAEFPAVTFLAPVSMVDSTYRTQDNVNNPVGRAVSRVQINCWGMTGNDAEAVADQAVQAWSGYKDGCVVGYAFIANRLQNRADALKQFRAIVDVTIEYAV